MGSVQDTYLGWELLEHRPACRRPQWTVDVRTARATRYTSRLDPGPGHGCTDEYCTHGAAFQQTTVRAVCTSCSVAYLITGERTGESGHTSTTTAYTGYGQAPRKAAGLWLWPGQPEMSFGRAVTDTPHDFLVTRERVARVTESDVVGQIIQERGARGGVQWASLAVPDPDGQYGYAQPVRFARATEGLRTPAAAVKWIATQLGVGGGS